MPDNELEDVVDDETSEGQDDQSQDEGSEDEGERKESLVQKLRRELKDAKSALKEKSKETTLKPEKETDFRFFLVENPEAKDMKDAIKETVSRLPNMSFEEAYAYAKATAPKQSASKNDFDLKTKSKPQDVSQLSDDEAAEQLSPSDYLKYLRQKGSPFVKTGLGRK